jgi:hypothetical protein
MFSTECAHLVKRHPDLATAAQKISAQFQKLGTVETIKPGDLASFLDLDQNQVRAVLDEFATMGLLRAEEMVECVHCRMPILRSEYEQSYEDDGEYRCTGCDCQLGARTIETVTTYRCGEKWPKFTVTPVVPLATGASSTGTSSPTTLDDQTFYDPGRLAVFYGLDRDALRKRLERYRKQTADGSYRENEGRGPRQEKYSYRLADIKNILTKMQASSQRPAK